MKIARVNPCLTEGVSVLNTNNDHQGDELIRVKPYRQESPAQLPDPSS